MSDIIKTLDGEVLADITNANTLPCIGERVSKEGHMYKVIDICSDLDTSIVTYTVDKLY